MVLGRIIGRILPKTATADSAAIMRTLSSVDPSAVVKSTISTTKRVASNTLDYGRKVLALPEGQVTTRAGRTYTRSMGVKGERVYTDANGNKTTFNGLFYKRPGYNESLIYRTSPDGGLNSFHFSIGNLRNLNRGRQEVVHWTRERIGGNCRTTTIELTPDGRVQQTLFDTFIGGIGKLSGIETRYGCPQSFYHTYGCINRRGVTEAPPIWTSLSEYTV